MIPVPKPYTAPKAGGTSSIHVFDAFGKRGTDTDPACFGGCCNPMNIRACGVGDIDTAESEGVIKRFGPSGEFLETAGVVKLTGRRCSRSARSS